MAAPFIQVSQDVASMAVDKTGSWVFTLVCGHTASLTSQNLVSPGSQIECPTCVQLAASGQPFPVTG